jgi:cytochrome c-type biogenesis protein CcmH/NrfG
VLQEAFRLDPAFFEVNNNLGAVYARQENYGASVDHYQRALAREPRNITVKLNLARALTSANDIIRAQSVYREILSAAPANWDALFELGKIHVSLGETAQAKQAFEDIIRRNPNYQARAEVERFLSGL